MPRCTNCGNNKTLASSLFPPASATANAPPYGLLVNFSDDGSIKSMECQGADLDDAQAAFEEPERFINACPLCGSGDIEWHQAGF